EIATDDTCSNVAIDGKVDGGGYNRCFFFSSRRRHTRSKRDWSSDVCSSDLWKPALLAVPNRLWFKLGLLLGKVVSPVALGILFYCVIAPIGVLARLAGKDPLRLKLDSGANSYWIQIGRASCRERVWGRGDGV